MCTWSTFALALRASPPLRLEAGRPVRLRVAPGRPVTVALSVADREPLIYVDPEVAWVALAADEHGWQAWCADIDGDLPHRDAVARSLLTLRLLTYSVEAPVAAPTTSLPSTPAGSATGTTATPGPATPASASAPSSASANTTRPATSSPGCSTPAAWTGPDSRCCSPSTAATGGTGT